MNYYISVVDVTHCDPIHPIDVGPDSHTSAPLPRIHTGHSGVNRMKVIARSCAHWPEISGDIMIAVRNCQKATRTAKCVRVDPQTTMVQVTH